MTTDDEKSDPLPLVRVQQHEDGLWYVTSDLIELNCKPFTDPIDAAHAARQFVIGYAIGSFLYEAQRKEQSE